VHIRAFSLIEMMLVVAILAVLAALAVPAMSPQVDITKLEGSAEAIGSFLARAQAEAMASKRCVRVFIDTSTTPAFMKAQKLNKYDCDVNPNTAPEIISGKGTWIDLAQQKLDTSLLTIEFDPVPSETTASALGNGEPDQIRFRPSGRLFSSDLDTSDDDGVIKVTHTKADIPNPTKKVLVESQGLICVLDRGTNPSGSGNNLSCP
jgi:prepilin-type N-terminal cleavage/methylation domain-containing protein